MTEMTEYAPGTFTWVDLQTSDPEKATEFYTRLFGWAPEDMPAGENGTYTMLKQNGYNVTALYKMPEEVASQGIPPHWDSYVSVKSADSSAEKAKSLGGTVIAEPFDVMEAGRMAVIQDPTGATFCLWQRNKHGGAQVVNEPCSLTWNELATRDVGAAQNFYTQLFDWSANSQQMGETEYTTFADGDSQRSGMLAMTDEWPAEVPPHWMVYFAVSDADDTVENAKLLGGTVVVEPRDIPDVGRFAAIADPQGATFSIIELVNPPS